MLKTLGFKVYFSFVLKLFKWMHDAFSGLNDVTNWKANC